MKKITSFRGQHSFLSNFHACKITSPDTGIVWPSAEHLYQSLKFDTPDIQNQIRKHPSKGLKAFVRTLGPITDEWDKVPENSTMTYKYGIMLAIVGTKFGQKRLAKKLLDTGDAYIEEGNYWHDNYWGNCTCAKCKNIPGQNRMGEILMKVREGLKKQRETIFLCSTCISPTNLEKWTDGKEGLTHRSGKPCHKCGDETETYEVA